MDENFMRLAIEKAKEGIMNGQRPYGACIVKDGKPISIAINTVNQDIDVTAHAEMNAIRDACTKLGTIDLSGCIIYATSKPCQMCQTACEKANISEIFYGVGPIDTETSIQEHNIPITGGILRKECLELVKSGQKNL